MAVRENRQRYRNESLVLETEFDTADGTVRVVDCMPVRDVTPDVVRLVQGVRGEVPVHMDLVLRFDYGSIVPWIEPAPDGVSVIAGADAFGLTTPLPLRAQDGTVSAEFVAAEGARERLALTWHPSYEETPPVEDADSALARTEASAARMSGR